MKVTKEKVAENREALIDAASELFRKHGIDGVGVAEVCKVAGLTHGALYAQFPSKEALATAAMSKALATTFERLVASKKSEATALGDYLDVLFSRESRDGCPIAAAASEMARQDKTMSAAFVDGHERRIALLEAALDDDPSATKRERAAAVLAIYLGTIVAARAAKKSAPRLSDEILATGRITAERAARGRRSRGR